MTTEASAVPDQPGDPGPALSSVERLVGNLMLLVRRTEREQHEPGNDTDWGMQQVVMADGHTARDVAAKLACVLYFVRGHHHPERLLSGSGVLGQG